MKTLLGFATVKASLWRLEPSTYFIYYRFLLKKLQKNNQILGNSCYVGAPDNMLILQMLKEIGSA